MSWKFYNPNPKSNLVGDCVVRALTLACGLCWDVDYSYARGRDFMGRYTSRDNGYSRDSKNDMINHLTDMMRSARTDEERESYRKTIDHLSR